MATITKSIGTASRDYSTITSWEADLDDFITVYSNGDDAVGECYNDSDFNEEVDINGGGTSMTGLNSITLTVPVSERHDGTAGTGARMIYSSKINIYSDKNINISWLEIDWGGTTSGSQFSIVYTQNNSYEQKISNMLIHDAQTPSAGRMIYGKYGYLTIANNVIYNLTHTGPYRGYGIQVDSYRTSYAYNNTVHNIASTHANAAYTFGIHIAHSNNVRNNIATEVGDGIYSGCFGNVTAGTNSNNMSTDGTAPGPNSLTEVTASAQFVSVVAGAEDLHLATGSEARGAGVSLSSAGDIVQYDIDGAYRGTVWDIGADQTPATVTKTIGTSSRDYSTITSWEAELDTQGVYASGDSVIGECYNDSTFGSFVLNGGSTIGLGSILLKPADGEEHDGTIYTGVISASAGANSSANWSISSSVPSEVRQIIIKRQHHTDPAVISLVNITSVVNRCVIYAATGSPAQSYVNTGFSKGTVINSILYGEASKYGIEFQSKYGANVNVVNNTILSGASSGLACLFARDTSGSPANSTVKNNLLIARGSAVGVISSTTSSSYPNYSHNMTNDSSFPTNYDTNTHTTDIDESIQFVSLVAGSEDLHLAGSSDAVDAGADLTGTLDGVEYDIDGQLRAGLWDIGADELLGGHIRRMLLGIG